jgi:hypothetical protein
LPIKEEGATPISAAQITNNKSITSQSPASGGTVVIPTGFLEASVWLEPSSDLATLTIVFPGDSQSKLGDIVRVGSSKNINSITLTGANILNPLGALSVNDVATYEKLATNTWVRLA